ncbi:MAG: D-aminoacyl-tRNA deacylase [Actinomycetota bacterium]|nr:D-aminoacyl-tRNA deacylase [Actinomycetota bacterium]
MRIVIQRVSSAHVTVANAVVGRIERGYVVLVGVGRGDDQRDVDTAVRKISEMRLFPDDAGRMNQSVEDVGGSVLVVSQFTLQADTRRGRRPSFTDAADAGVAEPIVTAVCAGLEGRGLAVARGSFGARMQVSLVNEGPVTIILEVVEGQVLS